MENIGIRFRYSHLFCSSHNLSAFTGEKLLDRVLTVKESGACEGVFDEMNVAGFISMDSNEPICK